MQLAPHFTLEELTLSSTAIARGINNSPPAHVLENLRTLAVGLEKVRGILVAPLQIDSGYRCEALNEAVRGVKTSAHVTGYAADFICPSFGTPLDIVRELSDPIHELRFDQLIQEGKWVHISFAPSMRGEVLTAHFVNGKATYQHGIE